jgi:hypothetical protein
VIPFRCFGDAHKYKYKPPSRTAVGFQVHNKTFGVSVKDGRTLEGMKGLNGRTDGTAVAAYCSATVAWLGYALKVLVCVSRAARYPEQHCSGKAACQASHACTVLPATAHVEEEE